MHKGCESRTNLSRVAVCYQYTDLAKALVSELKYHLQTKVAEIITNLILESIDIDFFSNAVLVPIPLHRFKLWSRGFNQAELIAQKLAKRINQFGNSIEVKNLVDRTRNTKTQVGMDKTQRMENLKQAFMPNFRLIKQVKISGLEPILIDDVMTTGTTLEECASILKKAGIKEVKALVFARG